jgi:hypothetical protein
MLRLGCSVSCTSSADLSLAPGNLLAMLAAWRVSGATACGVQCRAFVLGVVAQGRLWRLVTHFAAVTGAQGCGVLLACAGEEERGGCGVRRSTK